MDYSMNSDTSMAAAAAAPATGAFYPLVELTEDDDSSTDKSLFTAVQKAVSRELLQANNYTTRATIYLRVLKRVADYMGISWTMIQDLKNLVPIHRDCMIAVESIWQSQQRRLSAPVYTGSSSSASASSSTTAATTPSVTLDEMNTLEKFMSRDYARTADLIKLISILYKREVNVDNRNPRDLASFMTSAGWHDLYHLLAVDGFSGPELKNYWEALRYPLETAAAATTELEKDFRFAHIRAVRKMYKSETILKPDEVRQAISDAFERKESSENSLRKIYLSWVGTHFETIRKWKRYEGEQYQQKTAATKKITTFISKGGSPTSGGGEKRKRGRHPNVDTKPKIKKMKVGESAKFSSVVVVVPEGTGKKERSSSAVDEELRAEEEEEKGSVEVKFEPRSPEKIGDDCSDDENESSSSDEE